MNNNCFGKICTALRRFLIPLSSLLTVAVVSYISYSYLWFYLPAKIRAADINSDRINNEEDNEELEIPWYVILLGTVFILHPFFIFWALIAIVCGDPGRATRKLVD